MLCWKTVPMPSDSAWLGDGSPFRPVDQDAATIRLLETGQHSDEG
jgi:hypothetical protein